MAMDWCDPSKEKAMTRCVGGLPPELWAHIDAFIPRDSAQRTWHATQFREQCLK